MENTGKIVRAIRDALGETQRRFADRLETSQAMVARWELGNEPNTGWLMKLRSLAESVGLQDYADTLAGIAERDWVRPKIEVRTEEEIEQVNAVLRILRNQKRYPQDYAALKTATAKAAKDNTAVLKHVQKGLDIRRAIVRLSEKGHAPAEIAEILGLPEEAVTAQLGFHEMQKALEQATKWSHEREQEKSK